MPQSTNTTYSENRVSRICLDLAKQSNLCEVQVMQSEPGPVKSLHTVWVNGKSPVPEDFTIKLIIWLDSTFVLGGGTEKSIS